MDTASIYKDFDITAARMGKKGVLLVTGKGNPMTIGWGQLGNVWGKPVFTVLVRHSRFSHEAMEQTGEFSVNVLPESLDNVIGICGSKSGRDTDKISACNLNLQKSDFISVPHLAEAEIIYECKTIYKDEMLSNALPLEIESRFYPRNEKFPEGDYHTIYVAEVLNVLNRL